MQVCKAGINQLTIQMVQSLSNNFATTSAGTHGSQDLQVQLGALAFMQLRGLTQEFEPPEERDVTPEVRAGGDNDCRAGFAGHPVQRAGWGSWESPAKDQVVLLPTHTVCHNKGGDGRCIRVVARAGHWGTCMCDVQRLRMEPPRQPRLIFERVGKLHGLARKGVRAASDCALELGVATNAPTPTG